MFYVPLSFFGWFRRQNYFGRPRLLHIVVLCAVALSVFSPVVKGQEPTPTPTPSEQELLESLVNGQHQHNALLFLALGLAFAAILTRGVRP